MNTFKNPPRLAVLIQKILTRRQDEISLLDDMAEEYDDHVQTKGLKRARRWYWKQALRSIIPCLLFKFYWRLSMIYNYFKIAFRLIKRQRIYSLINILGLALGLSAFMLIAMYIHNELSFDRFHTHSDTTHRIIQRMIGHSHAGIDKMAVTTYPLAPTLEESYPEVVSSVRLVNSNDVKFILGQNEYFENGVFFTDPNFFVFFTFHLQDGDKNTVLEDPFSIVISQEMKEKMFGGTNAIGQTIQINEKFDVTVTGIMENMPKNSHIRTHFILPIELFARLEERDLTSWRSGSTYTYVRLSPETDPVPFEGKLSVITEKYMPPHGRHKKELLLQAMKDIHFQSNLDANIAVTASMKTLYLLGIIAVFILVIACINYINLTTARSIQRSREVGIRKVVGAQKRQLIQQFISEAFLFTILALIIATLIICLVLPGFNQYIDRDLGITVFLNVQYVLLSIFVVTGVALFAGGYPAFYISKQEPIAILRNEKTRISKRFSLRSLLVVIQFSISIILIICTWIVHDQLRYIQNLDVGYARDQIVSIPVKTSEIMEKLPVIKQELMNDPNILAVSSCSYLPNMIRDQTRLRWPGKAEDIDIGTYAGFIDYAYVDLFGLEIVQGRNFSKDHATDRNGAFLINEAAVCALGWQEPLGRELIHWNGTIGKVVGVVKDFNFHSLYRDIDPLYLFFEPVERNYYLVVKIRAGHIPETIASLKSYMRTVSTKYPFEYQFFDDVFNKTYLSEMKLRQIFTVFSIVAIFIASLGLLGLVSFTAEQRKKEIGIRKVLGSPISSIVNLLTREFLLLVLIANLIAWPVSYFYMKGWLTQFAYRADLNFTIFILAGGLTLFIAMLTVCFQSVKAARANPVDSIKYE